MNNNKHNDNIKTTLFLKTVIINFCLFWVLNVKGDSSFVAFKFWDISTNEFVLETGKKCGNQKINENHIDFFLNKEITLFDKLAMVNAIGPLSDSLILAEGFSNSDNFTYLLNERHNDSLEYEAPTSMLSEFAFNDTKLEMNLTLIYCYILSLEYRVVPDSKLRAFDDLKMYITDIIEYSDAPISLDRDFPAMFQFVKVLSSQRFAVGGFSRCNLGDFNLNITDNQFKMVAFDEGKSNYSIQNAHKVMSMLKNTCEQVTYNLSDYPDFKKITLSKNQTLWFVNYPEFVYGTVTVFDFNNKIVSKIEVAGKDLVEIKLVDFTPGQYTIEAQGKPKEREKLEHKSIGTKIYKVSLTVTE